MRLYALIPLAGFLCSCGQQSASHNAEVPAQDVRSLIASDDPKACAAPEAVSTALSAADEAYADALAKGMPAIRVDTISATGVNKDIHELACRATAHSTVNDGKETSFTILYKLRPALDRDGSYIAEIDANVDVKLPMAVHIAWWNFKGAKRSEAAAQDGSVPSAGEPAIAVVPSGEFFSKYPAQLTVASFATPSFEGKDASWAAYKTRILTAASEGPNYAGDYHLSYFGCGTQCVIPFIIDGSDGHIIDLPVGGEETPSLRFTFEKNSTLLKATWETYSDDAVCHHAEYNLEHGTLRELSRGQVPGECPIEDTTN